MKDAANGEERGGKPALSIPPDLWDILGDEDPIEPVTVAPEPLPARAPAASTPPPLIAVPEVLKSLHRWVGWAPDPETGRPKCPVIASKRSVRASTRKPDTWCSFDFAAKVYAKYCDGITTGIGFVFTADDGLLYVDVDDCISETGACREWAWPFVKPFMGKAYMEVSPSGRGLHIIAKGKLPVPEGVAGGKANFPAAATGARVPEVAMFTSGKYTTITGRVWKGQRAIQDATAEAAVVWEAAGIQTRPAGTEDIGRAPRDGALPKVDKRKVPKAAVQELKEPTAGDAEDRSAARWALYCELLAHLTPEETFATVLRATEWYEASGAAEKGREQTWMDIHRVAAKLKAQEEGEEFSAIEGRDPADDYVFIVEQDKYLYVPTRGLHSRSSVNAALQEETDSGRLRVLMPTDKGMRPRAVKLASHYLNRESEKADNVAWSPGSPLIVEFGGKRCANLFVEPPAPDTALPDPEPWLRHVEGLLPVELERSHVLDVLAFNVQYLGRKVNHALVLFGPLGSGKDLMLEPFRYWLRDCGGWTDTRVEDMVGNGFNQYLYRTKFLTIQESREMAFDASFGLYNAMKNIIAAPPPTVTVNLKNMKPFPTPNLFQVIFFTNYANGVYFEEEKDRRYFVTETASPRKTPGGEVDNAYYASLASWIDSNWPQVIGWLARRDVSAFQPGAPPPETEARHRMYAETRPAAHGEIGPGLAQVPQPFTAEELLAVLDVTGTDTPNVRQALQKGSRALGNLLRPRGFVRIEHKPYRPVVDANGIPTGERRRAEFGLWFHPDEMDADEAKRRFDERYARRFSQEPGGSGGS